MQKTTSTKFLTKWLGSNAWYSTRIQLVKWKINNFIAYISLISSQSEILKKDVYLIEKIEKEQAEKMNHLKAIYIVRPSEKNMAYLYKEVKEPKYNEYYICNKANSKIKILLILFPTLNLRIFLTMMKKMLLNRWRNSLWIFKLLIQICFLYQLILL